MPLGQALSPTAGPNAGGLARPPSALPPSARPLLLAGPAAVTKRAARRLRHPAAQSTAAGAAEEQAAAAAPELAPPFDAPPPPAAAPPAAAAQPPVSLVTCRTLPAQTSLPAALQQLRAAVLDVPASCGAYPSGLVRLEVPLPLGTRALRWLRGQPPAADTAGLLQPRIFFSPRRTTAADTEGSAAAGAAAGGAAAVAGAGAAWLWRGRPGEALGEGVMRDMQRFLAGAAAAPRIRAFGGARFNTGQLPAAEWAEFGSYCFMIPRLEFLEASGCNLLSCTVAWDASHAAAGASSSSSGASSNTKNSSSAAAVGFASVEAAVMDAVAALDAVQAPAAPAAGAFKLQRHGARHVPDEAGWHALMGGANAELAASAASAAAQQQQREEDEQLACDSGQLDACTPLLRLNPEAAREEYMLNGQEGLDDLLAALEGGFEASIMPQDGGLTKVVLARRTDVSISGALEPLALLEALQERDPRAYQLMLQMPSGATFLGSTPECLYTRTGTAVASEAVAGTRARGAGGDVERDFWLAFDLLRSHKDHVEFTVVRDWVQQALGEVCDSVQVDVAKSVLKQGAVQHLYGKLSAQLKPGSSDAHLLTALHPTPAVCGRPREDALGYLAASEPFDRGFYAGPFGWISQEAAEFVVAIRSALVQPAAAGAAADGLQQRLASHAAAGPGPQSATAAEPSARQLGSSGNGNGSNGASQAQAAAAAAATEADSPAGATRLSLFAGVGIVPGSDTAQEWAELDLKVRQYERLLQGAPPLAAAPNINALWARLVVEELCRLGCNTFCVAPGSRSSPLTVAVAQHPRARIVPCIDERSLGFWALGFGRATGRPAVVLTSSGTAVANLLPAAVEASQSGVPLLLLTGDRPAELRDSGANQTIDQVKIFGGFTRWHADLPAPLDTLPARTVLSAVDTAVQHATGLPAGPVHLNCQFREPLAPVETGAWDRQCLQGLQRWEAGEAPFTAVAALQPAALLQQLPAGMPSRLEADPAAAAALRAIAGARRGLIVAAELPSPEDVVAAAQLSQLLGWPVAADVLSGLRAGVPAPLPHQQQQQSAAGAARGPAVVYHFDHLLLLDRQQWQQLRPDLVLQLGGHLTSKRTNQFLEWCCLEAGNSGSSSSSGSGDSQQEQQQQQLQWIHVDRSPKRHDQLHLLAHRLQAPLPLLVAALAQQLGAAGASGSAANASSAREEQRRYCRLLQLLDGEASAAIDAALEQMPELTEPQVARTLSQQLPPGEGLFVGNSMPIRDLDMYAAPAAAGSSRTSSGSGNGGGALRQGVVATSLGAPVAANRGASGIDGVLSTAAGFADGLARGTTLVVGDISFLHDINGLNLLRSGEARPPLTVVLVNNAGGGIFSFLPIAEALPEEVFTPLWATPQHVDLEGMCRAHGIPHQKVAALDDLHTALHSAWSSNRHSVVEVTTSRTSNVERHREIQAAVKQAVSRALQQLEPPSPAPAAGSPVGRGGPGETAVPASCCLPFELAVQAASYQRYSLPLAQPLTTPAADDGSGQQQPQRRCGLLLQVSLAGPGGSVAHGVGEVAPLPGLHAELLQAAEQQLALLCQLMSSTVRVPLTVALLGGRLADWLQQGLGVAPDTLLPSVRCGLEAAVLSAIAQHQGVSLAQLLSTSSAVPQQADANGLLDCQGSPEEAAAEATALLQRQPFTALKLKVGRRADPLQDAAAVLAVRAAVGPGVALRADANRRWTLEQAVQFGKAAAGAGLQYIEEPVACTADLPEFHRRTRLPLALDESVDEGLVGPQAAHCEARCEGVAALVLKPAVLGGFERTAELAAWAQQRGMHAVVSSAFESSVGIAQLAQLAAALDCASGSGSGGTQHGLATLSWFAEDLLPAGAHPLLQPVAASSPAGSSSGIQGMCITVAAAETAASSSVALWQGLAQHQAEQEAAGVQQRRRRCSVHTSSGSYDFSLLEVLPPAAGDGTARQEQHQQQPPVLFLHGFLGAADDWLPLMRALGQGRRCLALDLPGHGSTAVSSSSSSSGCHAGASSTANGSNGNGSHHKTAPHAAHGNGKASSSNSTGGGAAQAAYSLEAAAAAVAALVQQEGLEGCTVVGYSLGARLALLLAARWPGLVSGVVSVSGTPGLADLAVRAERAASDDALAAALREGGLQRFVRHWYQLPMWAPLRGSPRFQALLQERQGSGDAQQLAAVLAAASPGRAPSVWRELQAAAAAGCLPPLLLVAGQEDGKFVGVAERLAASLAPAGDEEGPAGAAAAQVAVVPGCGHAVHIERPAELLALLQRFSSQCVGTSL